MNREEYLAELERLLLELPEEERQAAVQYYADYFEDSGAANEAEVIRELGSPLKVAESIKADYYGREFNEAEYEEKDYMEKYGQKSSENQTDQESAQDREQKTGKSPWTNRGLKILLIALIAIAAWPVSLTVACVALGLAAAAVGIFAALVIASAAVMVGGIFVVAAGVALLVIPPGGLIVIGTGILLFTLGLIAAAGSVKLCILVYPAMLRGFVNLCRRPLYGKAV